MHTVRYWLTLSINTTSCEIYSINLDLITIFSKQDLKMQVKPHANKYFEIYWLPVFIYTGLPHIPHKKSQPKKLLFQHEIPAILLPN